MSLEQSDARIQPNISGQLSAKVMRTGGNEGEPDGRTKHRINNRRRDAINRRRLHDHGSRSAIGSHINALRIGVIRSGSRKAHNGPHDIGSGGKSANAARRFRPASGAGSEQTYSRNGESDRRNQADFQKSFHNHVPVNVSSQPQIRCFRIRPCLIRSHQTPIRLEAVNLARDLAGERKPSEQAALLNQPNPVPSLSWSWTRINHRETALRLDWQRLSRFICRWGLTPSPSPGTGPHAGPDPRQRSRPHGLP
jgi:hypothetical protein